MSNEKGGNGGKGGGDDEIEQIIDLEEWAKAGKKPKPAKTYRIRIDKEKKDVTVPAMTGAQILALVNKAPQTHMLSQKLRGGQVKPVEPGETVRFDKDGVERFQTLALDPTEGEARRRGFQLPEEDQECLSANDLEWEAVVEGGTKWLIIPSYPIPEGYNHRLAKVALRIPPSYPDADIDMVYFNPPLALNSGKPIRQLSTLAIDGLQFQQWSRHRTSVNPWRPGVDNVCTHLLQVNNWLARELR